MAAWSMARFTAAYTITCSASHCISRMNMLIFKAHWQYIMMTTETTLQTNQPWTALQHLFIFWQLWKIFRNQLICQSVDYPLLNFYHVVSCSFGQLNPVVAAVNS